ncbi:MAG: NUDIX hydrolase [Elusimicrobia bacterium]|jgi:ADP-ribose pyrophosphatase YjhB (NUDIX family)|nr:NUDIX hydrolase [Elusimicrobiota bacterium]
MSFEADYNYRKTLKIPVLTVDVIIREGNDRAGNGIVLVSRKFPPLGWALPGGFVEKGELLEDAARREMKEETGLKLRELKQFHSYSDPQRDPRFHTVSVVFTAKSSGSLRSGSDAVEAKFFNLGDLPQKIVFDHRNIISDFKEGVY